MKEGDAVCGLNFDRQAADDVEIDKYYIKRVKNIQREKMANLKELIY
jgi:hypothetical protein